MCEAVAGFDSAVFDGAFEKMKSFPAPGAVVYAPAAGKVDECAVLVATAKYISQTGIR